MVECVVTELLVGQKLVHFVNILPDLGQVQWPEIFEETLVDEVLTEWEGTLSMLKKKALGMSLGGEWSAR